MAQANANATETLTVQLTAEEIAALRKLAQAEGKTASVMVRDWVRDRLSKK